jgi:uncharacterized membrane protein
MIVGLTGFGCGANGRKDAGPACGQRPRDASFAGHDRRRTPRHDGLAHRPITNPAILNLPQYGRPETRSMTVVDDLKHDLKDAEHQLLVQLRFLRRNLRAQNAGIKAPEDLTVGQIVADWVAGNMGSWKFIIIQTTILVIWIVLNVTAYVQKWDPYPFILLNLALSFQAAYAAPFIMMSQNRQQDIDRKEAEEDHRINIKAELEIELLHQKIDALREKEVLALTEAIGDLTELLKAERARNKPTKG